MYFLVHLEVIGSYFDIMLRVHPGPESLGYGIIGSRRNIIYFPVVSVVKKSKLGGV
jgi:hypothetical protein